MLNFKKIFEKISFCRQLLKASRCFYFDRVNPEQMHFTPETKCIVLSPHPDDETLGCGGLLSFYPDNFHVTCLTDGRHGSYEHNHDELIKIRQQEFKSSMEILGVKSYSFLDIEDRKLIKNYDKFKQINFNDYDYIFIPNFSDQQKDHKAVIVLLQKYIRDLKFRKNFKIVFYEVWAPLPVFNYYCDISGIIDKKKQAIQSYQSQTEHVDFTTFITSLNYYRGKQTSLNCLEVFAAVDTETFLRL